MCRKGDVGKAAGDIIDIGWRDWFEEARSEHNAIKKWLTELWKSSLSERKMIRFYFVVDYVMFFRYDPVDKENVEDRWVRWMGKLFS